MKIDAHHHYWHPARGDYGWMPKDNEVLYRAYGPSDLATALAEQNIDGTIVVQAAPSVEETEYLLGLADATPSILGVVGWVDFEQPSHIGHLTRLRDHPKFKGVRPMIQDIADVNWMLRDDVQWAYRAICDLDLSFDALGLPCHLPNFLRLMQRYPQMRVVYDHCMKPAIRDAMAGKDAFTDWAKGIGDLADKTSGLCKFSGLVTEATDGWADEDLRPFSDHILASFGAERVMWGSDWPVCRLQAEYPDWCATAARLTAHLGDSDRSDIFGGTAARFYRVSH